jgi:AraC-like DNA-binding protein
MQRTSQTLFVLHADAALRARLARFATLGYRVMEVDSWTSLTDALSACGPTSVAVVDPYWGTGRRAGLAPPLRALLRGFSSATVVAAMSPRPGWVAHVRRLGEWGIAEVIDLSTEDSFLALQMRLATLSGRQLRALLDGDLPVRMPGRARVVLEAALEVVVDGGHPREVARALGVSGHTLARWCTGCGLPVPRRLLMWLRVLLAAERLDDVGRSTLDVAFSCGYSSDRVLRRALEETVGMGARELREAGAFKLAADRFLSELQHAPAPRTLRIQGIVAAPTAHPWNPGRPPPAGDAGGTVLPPEPGTWNG